LVDGSRYDGGNAEEERDGGKEGDVEEKREKKKNLVRWGSGDSIQSGENDRALLAIHASFAHSLQQKKNPLGN